MRLVEVIVNVPIRRTFSRQALEGPPPEPDFYGASPEVGGEQITPDEADYQSFHYHLLPEFEDIVLPGHLVWVPFGAREVQGFVIGFAESSPVPTRAVLRLARKEPVLTSVQLELARWLAQAYVAPLAEALKLFMPPGLLTKEDDNSGVRAKRELQVSWAGGEITVEAALAKLARQTTPSQVLAWLLEQGEKDVELATLMSALNLPRPKATTALNSLAEKGLAIREGERVRLEASEEVARQSLAAMRGVDKFTPIVETLMAADRPLWKSEAPAGRSSPHAGAGPIGAPCRSARIGPGSTRCNRDTFPPR